MLPRLTDAVLRGHEVGEVRGDTCAGLSGRVLEIGFGSGLNVRWYPREVTEVHAVEPSDVAWRMSERRRSRTDIPIHRAGLEGEQIGAEDDGEHQAERDVPREPFATRRRAGLSRKKSGKKISIRAFSMTQQ